MCTHSTDIHGYFVPIQVHARPGHHLDLAKPDAGKMMALEFDDVSVSSWSESSRCAGRHTLTETATLQPH